MRRGEKAKYDPRINGIMDDELAEAEKRIKELEEENAKLKSTERERVLNFLVGMDLENWLLPTGAGGCHCELMTTG
jgi:hypothetical protein